MASRDINDLSFDLQAKFSELRAGYRALFPERDLLLTCTYRSIEEQVELYQSGRAKPGAVLTRLDGVRKPSKHNEHPARAFDVAVLCGGKAVWDDKYYAPLGEIAAAIGLSWGGAWKRFRDLNHFE